MLKANMIQNTQAQIQKEHGRAHFFAEWALRGYAGDTPFRLITQFLPKIFVTNSFPENCLHKRRAPHNRQHLVKPSTVTRMTIIQPSHMHAYIY